MIQNRHSSFAQQLADSLKSINLHSEAFIAYKRRCHVVACTSNGGMGDACNLVQVLQKQSAAEASIIWQSVQPRHPSPPPCRWVLC